jgi:hypothetical protein
MDPINKWLLEMYAVAVIGAVLAMLYPRLLARIKKGPTLSAQLYRASVQGWGGYLATVLAVSCIVTALGFAAFITGSLEDEVKKLGGLAFFSAFTFGFGAGSATEEPLKK